MKKMIFMVGLALLAAASMFGQEVFGLTGNVGVGVSNPFYKFEVDGGTARFAHGSGDYGLNSEPTILLGVSGVTRGVIDIFGTVPGAYSRIQTTDQNLHLDAPVNGKLLLNFYQTGSDVIINPFGGVVAIGGDTITPGYTLNLYGNAYIDGAMSMVGTGFFEAGGTTAEAYGLSSTPSLKLGLPDGSSRGTIDLFGSVPGAIARIQATTNNLHLDAPADGKIYLNRYQIDQETIINPYGGFVGIGTDNPTHELTINGTIRAEELLIDADVFPDYVFEDDYELAPLSEVESYIEENGHLPNIPSAGEVVENGIAVKELNLKMMEKIEELTLYIIELEKKVNALSAE